MELYCYQAAGAPALSAIPDLPLPRLPRGEDCPERFLLRRGGGRAVFCPSDPRQLFAETEDVRFLSPDSLGELPDLPKVYVRIRPYSLEHDSILLLSPFGHFCSDLDISVYLRPKEVEQTPM